MGINKFRFLFLSFIILFCWTNYAASAVDPLVLPGRLAASLSKTQNQTEFAPTKYASYSQSLGVSKDNGFCYLSGLSTNDNHKGVIVKVYLKESDNNWWIEAEVGKNNYVTAECIKWA